MKDTVLRDRLADFILLVTLGYATGYSVAHFFVTQEKIDFNDMILFECCVFALILPCFFKRAARIVGTIIGGLALCYVIYQVTACDAIPNLITIVNTPNYILMQQTGFITNFLNLIIIGCSLLAYFCSRSRTGTLIFWVIDMGMSIYLSYFGYYTATYPSLIITGCCAVLFFRSSAEKGLAGAANKHRVLLRTTFLSTFALTGLLLVAQAGYQRMAPTLTTLPKATIQTTVGRGISAIFPSSISGFGDYDPDRELGKSLTLDTTLVLEVQADRPFYLRGRIYDTYAGHSWQAGQSTVPADIYQQSLMLKPPGYLYYLINAKKLSPQEDEKLFEDSSLNPNPLLHSHNMTITVKTEGQEYFFLPASIDGIPPGSPVKSIKLAHTYPDLESGTPIPVNTSFSFSYAQPDWNSPEMKALAKSAIADTANFRKQFGTKKLRDQYDKLYDGISSAYGSTQGLTDRTINLALDITKGCNTEFEKADAIEKWLGKNCSYTLNPPQPPNDQDFVDFFLFDSRMGYCQHFATAMTELLRASGVPARYVEGYASPGANKNGIYEVTNAQAHAWVEYYSYLYGFVTADPTPASALPNPLLSLDKPQDSSSLAESSGAESSTGSSSSGSTSSGSSSTASSSGSSSSSLSSSQPSGSTLPAANTGGGSSSGGQTGKLGDSLRGLVITAGILLLIIAIYGGKALYRRVWFAFLCRKDKKLQVIRLYAYFVAVFNLMGMGVPLNGTPGELHKKVHRQMNYEPDDPDFGRVTEIYNRVRFGGAEPTDRELEELIKFYQMLPGACSRSLGSLRYLLLYPLLH